MPTFAVIAEHPPDLCPTSNAQTRQILKEGASQIPQLAEHLAVAVLDACVLAIKGRRLDRRAPANPRDGRPCEAAV